MVKTLTKHGNSMALVIDKPVLELLHIKPDTPLEITTDGESLIVSPVGNKAHEKKVKAAIKRGAKKYASALKKLAE